MANLSVLSPSHPLRPANWRSERAKVLVANNMTTRRSKDDQHTAQAVDYLRARAEAGDDLLKYEELHDRFGAFHRAHEIYTDSDTRVRHMLEAWLLSHISLEKVAVRASKPLEVVLHYEALFFNVHDRMDQGDWIMGKVLTQAVFEGIQQRDLPALWKLVAYLGGEYVLEAFIRLATSPIRPTGPQGVNAFCTTQSDNTQYRGRLGNTLGMRLQDPYTRLKFEEICLHLEEIRASSGNNSSPSEYSSHVEAMMRALPFGIGMDGRVGIGVPSLGKAPLEESGSRELRAHEFMLLRAGMPLPSFDGMPEPRFPDKAAEMAEVKVGAG
ncbi:MAG: hypothetical protein EXS09_20745 [Gemmataceae bacterium]|nr:hypothetical protein [Gemmataceae bacterium]